MATAQVSPDIPKPSFAKVAASVTKDHAPPPVVRRIATPSRDPSMSSAPAPVPTEPFIGDGGPAKASVQRAHIAPDLGENPGSIEKVTGTLTKLSLASSTPSLVVNGSGSLPMERPGVLLGRESVSDDSQRADSSSELGTKPPSLDGKSITSGTTFALDEKESLRPDDSASVKAAAEDDDAFSIRGSLVAGSRMGSEVAARARGMHLGDIPERRLQQPPLGISIQGALTPQSTSSEPPSGPNSSMPLGVGGSSDALNVIYRQAPDDKLLEAMTSPKDRLFLLRLEKQVIEFVQDSKEPYMDLPPSNSFCRMLTHKLADYYHMTHSYEPQVGSVRIFRTPFCRVPMSLALINPNPNPSVSSTPPPAVLPMKIMRRGQDGEGVPSTSPSKAASETGSDPKDKPPVANQKLTREEREEMYKLARERIFGSSEENVTETEGDNGVSRASSVSTKDKSNLGKRGKPPKQRRDDSDSFDSRNQYAPYWGTQQQHWMPQPPYMAQSNPPYSPQGPPPPYQGPMGPAYAQQGSGFPPMPGMTPNSAYPQYPMAPYQNQPSQQRYPPGGSPMTTYGAPVPPVVSQQSWQQSYNSTQFQPRGPPPPPGPQGGVGIPYAYGQLPANLNPNDPKSQHPIPGSYNRNHAFNPKTQSFVPGGSVMPPIPAPQPPFTAPGSHHSSPQIGSPRLAYPGYQQPMPPYGGGYGMARQGSSNSMPAYHTPHVQHSVSPMQQTPQRLVAPTLPQNPPHIPNRPNIPQGPSQPFSHLPTYGNPATLPQKPATGI